MGNKTVCRIVLVSVLMLASADKMMGAEDKKDEVVVTATRVEAGIDKIASSVTVITAADIEASQGKTVPDVLRSIPGVHVSRNGGTGKSVSVYLRGAKSEHVLVLIDGVDLNDPVSAGRAADLSSIGVGNVERIEVLRGAQSALYGSDAIGGVINIITKKGEGPATVTVKAEVGSFETYSESIGLHGSSGDINYSFLVSRVDTEGISVANEKDGNTEKDGYWNSTFSGRIGWTPSDTFDLSLILRYVESESELDAGSGALKDNLDDTQETELLFVRSEAVVWLLDSMWEQKFGVSYSSHDRVYNQPGDQTIFDSELLKFDWQNNLYMADSHIVSMGAEYEEEQGESSRVGPYSSNFDKKTSENIGVFAQDVYTWQEKVTVAANVRVDDHDQFGDEVTYRFAPVYELEETGTRFKATYGTGFKAPSLFQLYSIYGSEDLQPMKSDTYDIGLSQNVFSDILVVDVVYFNSQYEDMISYDFVTFKYGNISEAESEGVEVLASLRASDKVMLNLSYTYTDTEDKDTGKALKRIPVDRASFGASYRDKKLTANLGVVYVGERLDRDFVTSTDITMPDYFLVDISGSYDCTDSFQVFARVENLLDEEYEEVYGYGTAGLGIYGGVKVKL